MIIWLASYPKSGNTWVRLFLDSLFKRDNKKIDINNLKIRQFPLRSDFKNLNVDGDNIEKFVANSIATQDMVNLDGNTKIFKTHNAFWKSKPHAFTNEHNTKGVIYIVRDPRNVITSLKNHYSKDNYEEAFKMMTNENQFTGSRAGLKDSDLPTLLSSWSNHFNSWKKMNKNYLLIKYENLLNAPENEFNKIVRYLNYILDLNISETKTKEAIRDCNFDNLKKEENKKGFKEAATDKKGNVKKFFYLGPKNNWKDILDTKTIDKIEKEFKNEMLELGYL